MLAPKSNRWHPAPAPAPASSMRPRRLRQERLFLPSHRPSPFSFSDRYGISYGQAHDFARVLSAARMPSATADARRQALGPREPSSRCSRARPARGPRRRLIRRRAGGHLDEPALQLEQAAARRFLADTGHFDKAARSCIATASASRRPTGRDSTESAVAHRCLRCDHLAEAARSSSVSKRNSVCAFPRAPRDA